MGKKVLVPIADGSEEIEAVCIIDTLRRANAQVIVASVHPGRRQIEASRGVRLVADCCLEDCADQDFDAIILPGGLPGAQHLQACQLLARLLREQDRSQRLLGAICASPALVLEPLGLLRGRRATCHPSLLERLRNAQAVKERVVVDGHCVTSQAPGTALEFALAVTGILFGAQIEQQVRAPMEIAV